MVIPIIVAVNAALLLVSFRYLKNKTENIDRELTRIDDFMEKNYIDIKFLREDTYRRAEDVNDALRGNQTTLDDYQEVIRGLYSTIGLLSFKTDDDNQITNNSTFEKYGTGVQFKVSNIRQEGKRCVKMKFEDKSTEIIPEDDFYQQWYNGDITKI